MGVAALVGVGVASGVRKSRVHGARVGVGVASAEGVPGSDGVEGRKGVAGADGVAGDDGVETFLGPPDLSDANGHQAVIGS